MRTLNPVVAVFVAGALCSTITAQDALAIKRKLEEFGPGVDVKFRLADGNRGRGLIGKTGTNDFEIRLAKKAGIRSFNYAQVASVDLARRAYRSNQGRDSIAAHRVAVALGPGHHVLTRVRAGKTYRGQIASVDREEFTLLLDHAKGSVAIPYVEIDHLEQNLSRGAKIGIVAAVAAGVGLLIFWRYVIDQDE